MTFSMSKLLACLNYHSYGIIDKDILSKIDKIIPYYVRTMTNKGNKN